jgi:hypothetical protein
MIASRSRDNTIKLWDLNIEALLPTACEDLKNQMEHRINLKERSLFQLKKLEIQKKCGEIILNKQ